MQFPYPLIPGTLIKRYKRFLVDVSLASGEVVTAHSVNTGSMHGVLQPGNQVWLSPANDRKRKLKYTWEIVEACGVPIGINTSRTNALAQEAIEQGRIAELRGYDRVRREVKYGVNSRIDLLLEAAGRPACYVEVKNVHMRRTEPAEFPDSVSIRAAKHMTELAHMVDQGARAVVLFIVQRADCEVFSVASDIDPAYNAAFEKALENGVESLCYACSVAPEGIAVEKKLKIERHS